MKAMEILHIWFFFFFFFWIWGYCQLKISVRAVKMLMAFLCVCFDWKMGALWFLVRTHKDWPVTNMRHGKFNSQTAIWSHSSRIWPKIYRLSWLYFKLSRWSMTFVRLMRNRPISNEFLNTEWIEKKVQSSVGGREGTEYNALVNDKPASKAVTVHNDV